MDRNASFQRENSLLISDLANTAGLFCFITKHVQRAIFFNQHFLFFFWDFECIGNYSVALKIVFVEIVPNLNWIPFKTTHSWMFQIERENSIDFSHLRLEKLLGNFQLSKMKKKIFIFSIISIAYSKVKSVLNVLITGQSW